MAYRRGHTKGIKKEKPGSQDWYRTIEQANIRRIEAELTTSPLDNGQQAFASGVCRAGESIAPGFGLFIHQCVQRAIAHAKE